LQTQEHFLLGPRPLLQGGVHETVAGGEVDVQRAGEGALGGGVE
jgi:hypothetical protein